jgi:very-short-patch-repair endonuclease
MHLPKSGVDELRPGPDPQLADFVWRDQRLIVEVDGYRYHRSPRKFESDREQDVTLGMKGWTTRRFTWRQITRREAWVADAVRTGAHKPAE